MTWDQIFQIIMAVLLPTGAIGLIIQKIAGRVVANEPASTKKEISAIMSGGNSGVSETMLVQLTQQLSQVSAIGAKLIPTIEHADSTMQDGIDEIIKFRRALVERE